MGIVPSSQERAGCTDPSLGIADAGLSAYLLQPAEKPVWHVNQFGAEVAGSVREAIHWGQERKSLGDNRTAPTSALSSIGDRSVLCQVRDPRQREPRRQTVS